MSFSSRSKVGFLLSLISFVAIVGIVMVNAAFQRPADLYGLDRPQLSGCGG